MRHSLEGKLALVCALMVCLVVAVVAGFAAWLESWTTAILIALLIMVPFALVVARWFVRPLARTLLAVSDGITSMKDHDFSVSISAPEAVELEALVRSYNGLGELLRNERQSLYQRELLLDTVIQATPLAMVLTNATDRIVYSNVAARQAFLGGRKLEGLSFSELLDKAPEPLRHAVEGEEDTLFTIEGEGESSEIYHLSQRGFLLNSQSHRLYLLKQLTRELSRQEVETWKRVIRVIAHELNNSLAPISSLAHSGRHAPNPDQEQLQRIFRTIEDRAKHLHSFIDGYARFAKLPKPRPEAVEWGAFLRALQDTSPFAIEGDIPARPGVFDAAQIEQVLINLVKNAREAGAPAESVALKVDHQAGGWRLRVLDRGLGMSEDVLRNALLPFYSTKPAGAGLGLTVCREVIEAHGGRISLANRPGGGLTVTLWIPEIKQED